jgi:hypothetical protein
MCSYWKKCLKIFFSRTSRQISIKIDTNYPCIKEFKFVQIKSRVLFKEEINHKNRVGSFKNVLSRTIWPEKLSFTQKLPDIMQIEIFENCSPWGQMGPPLGKTFYIRL